MTMFRKTPQPQPPYDNRNVSELISKFEVRNLPKNRGMQARPEYGADAASVQYARRERERQRAPGARSHRPLHYGESDALYDSADSLPMTMDPRYRPQQYHHNGSLSSLNESDYYDDPQYYHHRTHATVIEEDEPPTINKEQVASSLSRFGAILSMLARIPFPRMSVTGMGLCSLVAIFICPRTLGANLLFPGFRLLFGTLYPAYASYKAVRTKNVKEYVKWMMYWIVFAFFTCIETFTDILLSWFPFYYEIKVVLVLWLLSPATRGSSTLYRKFVHPMLTRREQEIDDYINQAKEKGYTAVLQLGSKGVNYATNVIMQTAIKAFNPLDLPSMRLSQSDNALVTAAASAMHHHHPISTHTTYQRSDDQHDGIDRPEMMLSEDDQLLAVAAAVGASSPRVRRSQSVDSALSRVTTRQQTRGASLMRHPGVIYEMDSDEEEPFLSGLTATGGSVIERRSSSRNSNSTETDGLLLSHREEDAQAQVDSEQSSSSTVRSKTVGKRKTATTSTGTVGRTKAKTSTATKAQTAASVTARGRKKPRKDSDPMDIDLE